MKDKTRAKAKIRTVSELCALPKEAVLTTAEAALYTAMSVAALRIRRSKGNGPKYLKNNSIVRYRKVALDFWLGSETKNEEQVA